MKHIILLGDSIFDNGFYVEEGDSVSEILSELIKDQVLVTLVAMDGHTTRDVSSQLTNLPPDATHVFLSYGGNDGLQAYGILQSPALSVEGALKALYILREEFRDNYRDMLDEVLTLCNQVAICTIYNKVPGITESEETALALFNEIIMEEAIARELPVIDLRLICDEPDDCSIRSPIEPSGQGVRQIAEVIYNVSSTHTSPSVSCIVYR